MTAQIGRLFEGRPDKLLAEGVTLSARRSRLEKPLTDEQKELKDELLSADTRGLIIGYFVKKGIAKQDAEDLAQEVLIYVDKNIRNGKYNPRLGNLRQFILMKAHDVLVDFWRRVSRRALENQAVASFGHYPGARDWEEKYDVEVFIKSLPETFREVARLKICDGLNSKEVAARLDIMIETVNTRFYRIRQLFSAWLENQAKEADAPTELSA